MDKLVILTALLATSCLRDTSFTCSRDADCGAGGTCEPGVNYCSVVDHTCPSGSRFVSSAGSYAGTCVRDDGATDAGRTDAPATDAASDAPTGCPANYQTIAGGQGTHRYRVINTTDTWQTQRGVCATSSSSAYLAIPDDPAELAAIATLSASSSVWVGISDTATENTFLTVKGAAATFLPWDNGQPDDQGPGEDCVIIRSSSSKLRDERCNTDYRAVCECEP